MKGTVSRTMFNQVCRKYSSTDLFFTKDFKGAIKIKRLTIFFISMNHKFLVIFPNLKSVVKSCLPLFNCIRTTKTYFKLTNWPKTIIRKKLYKNSSKALFLSIRIMITIIKYIHNILFKNLYKNQKHKFARIPFHIHWNIFKSRFFFLSTQMEKYVGWGG